MRTLPEQSGSMMYECTKMQSECTRMYENAKSEFEFLLIHLSEKIDGFCRLAVFIVHFNERGRVSLSYNVDFQKFV